MMKDDLIKDHKELSETIFSSGQKVCSEEKIYDIFYSSTNIL